MKILITQSNGEHEANRHFRECFALQRGLLKLEHEVDVWGKGHGNFKEPMDFNSYDLIVNLENYDSGWVPSLAGATRPLKFLWVIDAHCRSMNPYMREFRKGEYDLILQASQPYLNDHSVWFPNAYDDTLIEKRDVEKQHFLGFCGSVLNRQGDISLLKKRFDLHTDIWVLGDAMVEAINGYKIHWNRNISNDINYRSFETIGCGTVICTNANKQYSDLGFVDGENCILYTDTRDMITKLKFYEKNLDKLDEIAARGMELAKSHTYFERAKTLVEIYKEKRNV
jgi:hypothetical protein